LSKNRVLIVAAHPDDEVLGCGGAIARHIDSGDIVKILIIADGVSSRNYTDVKEKKHAEKYRYIAANNAAMILGSLPPKFLSLPDNKLDSIPLLNIVKEIETIINEFLPTIIYTHHGGDLNIDHAITYRAVMTAARPLPGSNILEIYGFEIPSSTEWGNFTHDLPFHPVHYIEISEQLQRKQQALACYDEELRMFPHPRSLKAIEVLSQFRGVQSGMMAAEAFSVLRQLKK